MLPMVLGKSVKATIALIVAVLLSLAAFSCATETPAQGKLGVAVTILPQAEFVKKVGEDKVDVTVMVPSGADPHSYEPSPVQMSRLSRASMYAMVGSGVEFEIFWMKNIIDQNREMLVVDCSKGIDQLPSSEEDGSRTDPHVWLSPANAGIMVRNIADGLVQIDPENREYYEANRDSYLAELEDLDRELGAQLAGAKGATLLTYHPFLAYFAASYGFQTISIEDEGHEPSFVRISEVLEAARSKGIKTVFNSTQSSSGSADMIAGELEGRVVTLNPLAEEYIENLRAIALEITRAQNEQQ